MNVDKLGAMRALRTAMGMTAMRTIDPAPELIDSGGGWGGGAAAQFSRMGISRRGGRPPPPETNARRASDGRPGTGCINLARVARGGLGRIERRTPRRRSGEVAFAAGGIGRRRGGDRNEPTRLRGRRGGRGGGGHRAQLPVREANDARGDGIARGRVLRKAYHCAK
jgi:hypothetical protein